MKAKLKKHLGKAFATLLMWLAFSLGVLVVIVLQLLGIIAWLFTADPRIHAWVKATGKGTDGVNNAAWFGGNSKETISSHAGRWILAEREERISRAPAWAHAVAWVTGLFEPDHVVKAIEAPFKDMPLMRD